MEQTMELTASRSYRFGYRLGRGATNVWLAIPRYLRALDLPPAPAKELARIQQDRLKTLLYALLSAALVPWVLAVAYATWRCDGAPQVVVATGLSVWAAVAMHQAMNTPLIWPGLIALSGATGGVAVAGGWPDFVTAAIAMAGLYLVGLIAWVIYAGWDGTLTNDLGETTTPVDVDGERVRRVVAAAIGLTPDTAHEVRVVGAGLTWDAARRWWTIKIKVPPGKSSDHVRGRQSDIAAALDLGVSRLLMEIDPDNHSIITLSGTNTDPWAAEPVRSSLLDAEQVSIWDPIPFGTDAKGNRVNASLLFTGWVIGSRPRRGKTNAMRLLGLAAALDPHCDLDVWDLKGGSDWAALEAVAVASGAGPMTENIQALAERLQEIKKEVAQRAATIRALPASRCPESKITRELAIDPALNLRPHVILIDEVHAATEHPTLGAQITRDLADICRGAPAYGVVVVIATQRPSVKSIPAEVRDQLGTRYALHVTTAETSKTILGTTDYRADQLPAIPGVGILYGADDLAAVDDGVTLRTDTANTVQVEAAIQRAITTRTRVRGVPTQRVANEKNETRPPLLQEIATIITVHGEDWAGDKWIRSTELAKWLGTAPTTLASQAAEHGVSPARYGNPQKRGYSLSSVL